MNQDFIKVANSLAGVSVDDFVANLSEADQEIVRKLTEAADGEIVRIGKPATLFRDWPLIWVDSLPADEQGADEPTIVEGQS